MRFPEAWFAIMKSDSLVFNCTFYMENRSIDSESLNWNFLICFHYDNIQTISNRHVGSLGFPGKTNVSKLAFENVGIPFHCWVRSQSIFNKQNSSFKIKTKNSRTEKNQEFQNVMLNSTVKSI